jgi:hypothetical protein
MMQTQILLAILIPTLTVLVGILLNRNDYSKLEGRLSAMENRLDSRIGGVESRLDSRMNGLEARFHADMLMVIGKLTELEIRVARA